MKGENKTQSIARLQYTLAYFIECPSANNYLKMQKAMMDYQDHRAWEKSRQEKADSDYLCENIGKRVEYRCTINGLYSNPRCQGYDNLEARDADYIPADSPEEALEEMRSRYPDFVSEGFTVEIWKVLE